MSFSISIPDNANKIIHTLQNNGHSAYVVGGCVRDSLMGRTPHDWDICTSATPEQMLEIFKNYRVIETGLKHGTVTIVIDGEQYECTTYRIDGKYSDNRRPDNVIFTNDLVEDLRRRDFTINAMAYNDAEGLIDPFSGSEAIKGRTIRCVDSAKDRFDEDALRILRAIRFAAQFDFTIAPDTDLEIRRQFKNLENISVERINSEFCKIAATDNFSVMLLLYKDVFSLFIPELKDILDFPQNNPHHDYDVFDHTVHAVESCNSDDLIVRLAVFFHDFGKPHSYQDGEDGIRHFKGHGRVSADITDTIMKRLKFDNETRNNVVQLVYYHDAAFEIGKKYVKRWLNKLGEKQFRRLLYVRRADIKGQKSVFDKDMKDETEKLDAIEDLINEVLQENQCFTLRDLAVNGNDLIEMGYEPGKQLGEVLDMLLSCVINEEFENEKNCLLNIAKERLLCKSTQTL